MDLTDPTRAITTSLDGPVLSVLASTGRPLTVGEIAQQVSRGSEIGIRKAVARLVDQGIVVATKMGRNVVHELNRDHIAAPVAVALSGLRNELWTRLRNELLSWEIAAKYACVFGSAARRDGNAESDIDVLVVHPHLPEDEVRKSKESGLVGVVENATATLAQSLAIEKLPLGATSIWNAQIAQLQHKVLRWTGNPLQIVDVSFSQWTMMGRTDPSLQKEILRDAIIIAGKSFVVDQK